MGSVAVLNMAINALVSMVGGKIRDLQSVSRHSLAANEVLCYRAVLLLLLLLLLLL